MKKLGFILIWLCLILMSVGCFGISKEVDRLQEARITLKIFTSDKSSVEKRFLDVINLYYPDLNVVVLDEGFAEASESGDWKTWFEHHQPDLIVSSGKETYQQLIEQQLILALDTQITHDDYSLDALVPGAIEWLRMQSPDNQLYGLPTEFYNRVIFYNKEHFDEQNIPYPNLHTSWIELLQLARQFQETEIYGLQTWNMSPLSIIYDAGFTENLNLYDGKKGEVYVRSDAWKQIWDEVMKTVQSGVIIDRFEIFPDDVAMVFSNYASEYNSLVFDKESRNDKWEVIYYPVNINRPNENHIIRVDNPISIYSKSSKKEYAWQLLTFLTGKETARYEQGSISTNIGFPIWHANIQFNVLENEQAFYDVMPTAREMPFTRSELNAMNPVMNKVIDAVLTDEMTLEEALIEFEAELQHLISKGVLK